MDSVMHTIPMPSTPADILSGYMRLTQEYEADPADRPDVWGKMRALDAHAVAPQARDAPDLAVKLRLLAAIGTETAGCPLLESVLADAARIGGTATAAAADPAPVPGLDRLKARARQRGQRWAAAVLARHGVRRFADLSAGQVSRELQRR